MRVVVIGAGKLLIIPSPTLHKAVNVEAIVDGVQARLKEDGLDYQKIVEEAQSKTKTPATGLSEPPYIIRNYRQDYPDYERIAKPMKTHIDNRKVFRHTKRKKR